MKDKILPDLKKRDHPTVKEQRMFRGLCTQTDSDGYGLLSMCNWLPEEKGSLIVRPSFCRYVAETVTEGSGRGFCVHNGELMMACGTGLYCVWGHDRVEKVADLEDTAKQFVSFGHRLIVLPDRVWYDPIGKTCYPLEISLRLSHVALYKNIMSRTEGSWCAEGLQTGDCIELNVAASTANSGRYRILEMDDQRLVLDRSFSAEGVFQVEVSRPFPPAEYLCVVGDRLMGCGNHRVYVCEKGHPFNWEADAAWGNAAAAEIEVAGMDDFTGCACWQGYALFFKEDHIYKLMGNGAGSYFLSDLPAPGVAVHSARSLRPASGSLYYLSPSGLCRYDGGYPQRIGLTLKWNENPSSPCGSGDAEYYYLGGVGDQSEVYALHTRRQEWFRLDAPSQFYDMLTWKSHVYALDEDGALWQLAYTGEQTGEGTDEWELCGPLQATLNFDFASCRFPDARKLSSVSVLADALPTSGMIPQLTVSVQYDGADTWHEIGQFQGEMTHRLLDCPVVPRQCDFYRLRLETVGKWRIKGIYRVYEK